MGSFAPSQMADTELGERGGKLSLASVSDFDCPGGPARHTHFDFRRTYRIFRRRD